VVWQAARGVPRRERPNRCTAYGAGHQDSSPSFDRAFHRGGTGPTKVASIDCGFPSDPQASNLDLHIVTVADQVAAHAFIIARGSSAHSPIEMQIRVGPQLDDFSDYSHVG
jgi:hypothetical protein